MIGLDSRRLQATQLLEHLGRLKEATTTLLIEKHSYTKFNNQLIPIRIDLDRLSNPVGRWRPNGARLNGGKSMIRSEGK